MSTNSIQDEIINEFSLLDGDQEMTVLYVMELGQKLPEMNEKSKTEDNIVKGCQSKVWMAARIDDGKMFFEADSNTAITKGLVSLLVRIFSGQPPEVVLNTDLYFMKKIGMERFIGTQRSNGFASMLKQFKFYALAYNSKINLPAGKAGVQN
jgi:cysteine desulfuration protein SufE